MYILPYYIHEVKKPLLKLGNTHFFTKNQNLLPAKHYKIFLKLSLDLFILMIGLSEFQFHIQSFYYFSIKKLGGNLFCIPSYSQFLLREIA